ncbi:MAG TPA: SOS response-associated peptidase [Cyclobacteriaceae bacterium]|nr:SOS response-associated peptidase [Cyclobacteriaceae bacterium]
MFVRYSLTYSSEEAAQAFGVDVPAGYEPQYNAAPTHLLPVITQDSQKGFSFFYWGAPPSRANKKALGERIINTRVELIREKPVLLKRIAHQRCIVPADGYYDWKKIGKKANVPYRFTLKSKDPFFIAGTWEEYEDENGETLHTFNLITTEPSPSVAIVSERMPAMLSLDAGKLWLNFEAEDEIVAALKPSPETLEYYSVSQLVNFPDRNNKLVILPAPAADQYGNLTLFD